MNPAATVFAHDSVSCLQLASGWTGLSEKTSLLCVGPQRLHTWFPLSAGQLGPSHSKACPGKTDFLHGSWVPRGRVLKIESRPCVFLKSVWEVVTVTLVTFC